MTKYTKPLIIKDLSHSFGVGETKKQILFDINLEVASGELVVLVGASGSGKTTLLTLIGCLRKLQEGSIKLLGKEIKNASDDFLTNARKNLGFIFQAHNLHESLNAIQNVQMGLDVLDEANIQDSFLPSKHLLEILGLGERIDYMPSNLSGGQKQRVAIARALVSNPQIILADEPTAALDKEASHNVITMLKDIGSEYGTTTIMVTHDQRVLEMADRIITLEDGKLT